MGVRIAVAVNKFWVEKKPNSGKSWVKIKRAKQGKPVAL